MLNNFINDAIMDNKVGIVEKINRKRMDKIPKSIIEF